MANNLHVPTQRDGVNDLFLSFNQKKANEIVNKCRDCMRTVIIGSPRSGKSFFIEKHLKDKLPNVTIEEFTVGVGGHPESGIGIFNRIRSWVKKLMDRVKVDDEELMKLLGEKAPKHIVEDVRKKMGDSPHIAYYISWSEAEDWINNPSEYGISEYVKSALGFIIDAFRNKKIKIKWINAEYIPPGLVKDVLELIRSKGLDEAKEELKIWVDAYFEALKILGIHEKVEWESTLSAFVISFIEEVMKGYLTATQFIISGIFGGGVAAGLVAIFTHKAFKESGGNYINEMLKLRENLRKLCKQSSDDCKEFNELGKLIVYKVASTMGIRYEDVQDALKYIIGLSEEEFKNQLQELKKRIEEVEKELREVKAQVKGSLVGEKVFFINDVENGLLYGNFIVEDGVAKIKTRIGAAGEKLVTDLVDTGKFHDVAKEVFRKLTEKGRVLLVGPKGIGKSTLATYVIWNSLIGSLGDITLDEPRDAVIRIDSLGDAEEINNLVKATKRRFIIIYDPSPIEAYIKPEAMKKMRYDLKSMKDTLNELLQVIDTWVIIVLPQELYDVISKDEELKSVLESIESSKVDVNLKDEDFLRGIIKSYSGCQVVPEGLLEIIKQKYSGGYTLSAKYAGIWLRKKNCEVKDVVEALNVSEPKLFFAHYIWDVLLGGSMDLAMKVSVPLMLHAAYGAIPEGITYITKAVNVGGVWGFVDKNSLKNIQLSDLKEEKLEPIVKWLSIVQEDLVEETLEELAGLYGENEKEKYIQNGLESLVNSLKWGYDKVLKELEDIKVLERERVWENLILFIGERLKLKLKPLSNNCWKRAALIIGHGLTWHSSLPRVGDLPEDVAKSLNGALYKCEVDDYLLVGNEIPPLIGELFLAGRYWLIDITEAFIDKYEEVVNEIKNILNNARNTSVVNNAELFYWLGLASIVAYAVRSGKNISSDDADAVLNLVSSVIQRVASTWFIKPIQIILEPLRNKVSKSYRILIDLGTGEEKIKLETERKIDEKLEQDKGIIVVGYPSSGLITLYLEYCSRLPDREYRKLSIERYEYDAYDKNSFTDIMDGLRNGQKVALFIPEYTFNVYLDEYLKEHRNEQPTYLKKDIMKYVVIHTVSREEAKAFLERLIDKSEYKKMFDDDLKERILNLVKQTEEDGSMIPRNTETYPLGLLKDVFEEIQKRFANNEQYDKIKDDLDRKIEIKDETEKFLSVGIIFGVFFTGTVPPSLEDLKHSLYGPTKSFLRLISSLLGGTRLTFAFIAIVPILLAIKEYLKHGGERNHIYNLEIFFDNVLKHGRERMTTQFDKFLQLKEYWDSLKDSERKMLCYKLDKKNKLKPGASEEYLNYIFTNKWEDVENEINEIKNNLDGFENRLKALKSEYPNIIQLLNELSRVNEDINLIKDNIEFLIKEAKKLRKQIKSAPGLEQVDDIKTLQEYYNVDPTAIADIHNEFEITDGSVSGNRSKMSFSSLVEELWNWDENKPGVYVITGPSGTGKSWFTYRVISEIFNRNEKEKLMGRNRFAFFKITEPDIFTYPVIIKSGEKALLFIDDSQIEVDKIDQFKNILNEFLDKDNRTSPIIITIEYNKWERLLREKIKSLEISNLNTKKDKLEKKLRQIFLERTSGDEIKKVLESLSKSAGILVPENLKDKIVEKAAGLPIIIKIFIESIKKKKSEENRELITESDVEDIDVDPTKYATKKLLGYYIPKEWHDNLNDFQEEISEVLSLLSSILKLNKPMPLAFLDINFLREILNYNNEILLYKILGNSVRKAHLIDIVIENNKLEFGMPFFKLNKYGFLNPMHDVVRGGMGRVIYRFKDYYTDYTDQIVNDFNLLFNQKIDEIFKGAEFKIGSNIKNAYYLLSLSIISDDTEYQIKALEFTSKINEKKLSENIDLLSSQIIAILRNIIREHQLELVQKSEILDNLIEKLLKTNEQDDRLEIWDLGLKMFYKKAISKEVLAKNKKYFIELLRSENEDIRDLAWFKVQKLIKSGIISKEDVIDKKEYFIGLLSSKDSYIRRLAWSIVSMLLTSGIISKEDAIYFIELLRSEDEDIKQKIRYMIPILIKYGIFTEEELKRYMEGL
jgi:GTPase SAR1 family protein